MSVDKYEEKDEKINKMINLNYQNKIRFSEFNEIYIKYKESIIELRNLVKELKKFPSPKEWNDYAQKYNLLSSESIKYISGTNWHGIRNKIR